MKKLNILLAHDGSADMPEERFYSALCKTPEWSTEISVFRALKKSGHNIRTLAVSGDPSRLMSEIAEDAPDIVFNLAEGCLGEYINEYNLPALFEMLGVPFTGCSPVPLVLCNNKAVSKTILKHHSIPAPGFIVARRGEKTAGLSKLSAPFFVKPLNEEASCGISRRSLAADEKQCLLRVSHIHNSLGKDAIVEEYVPGREIYFGVFGYGGKVTVLPPWELKFNKMKREDGKIATYSAKWDDNYRKKWDIKNEAADYINPVVLKNMKSVCEKAYSALGLDAYARFDLRLRADGDFRVIEANANPELCESEDFAASAAKGGIPFGKLINIIIGLGL